MIFFHPQLRTHKLHGFLSGYHAFSIGWDFRVVFKVLEDGVVEFSDLGKHDDVY